MKKVILVLLLLTLLSFESFAPEEPDYVKQDRTIRYYTEEIYKIKISEVNNRIKNNNPFNIRYSRYRSWEGRSGISKNGFEIFTCTEYGIKAGYELLYDYYYKKNKRTIESVLYLYAPPFENNTSHYVNYLSSSLGFPKNQEIPIENRKFFIDFCFYMIKMETGQEITRDILNAVYDKHFMT